MKKIFFTILFIIFTANTVLASNIADEINSKNCGDIVSFGRHSTTIPGLSYYRGEDISNWTFKWYILAKENGKALLMTKDAVAKKRYMDIGISNVDEYLANPYTITWENCTLRKWLNDEFYNSAFNDDEKSYIIKSHNVNNGNPYSRAEWPYDEHGKSKDGKARAIDNANLLYFDFDNEFFYKFFNKETFGYPDGCADTDDNVFLLSLDEFIEYIKCVESYKDDEYLDRVIVYNDDIYFDGYHPDTWLRTPGESQYFAIRVNDYRNGIIYTSGVPVDMEWEVRPCIWVSTNGYANNNVNNSDNNITDSNTATDTNYINDTDADIDNTTINETNTDNFNETKHTDNINETTSYIENTTVDYSIIENTKEKEIVEETITDIELIEEKPKGNDLTKSVYYYAKQNDKNNKIYTSINKKTLKDGIFGTGLFSRTDETYYNIEIKLNTETTKRLSNYADFSSYNKTFLSGIEWVLLAGESMNDLENVSDFGITPAKDNNWLDETEGLSYYQNGKIQINCKYKSEQEKIYNKIKNANVLILATNNVVESFNTEYIDETRLGEITKFESQKAAGGINWVTGYVDCEDDIVKYSKNHLDYSLYVYDGNFSITIYDKTIFEPIKKCPSFNIKIDGTDSLSYAMYGNAVNYLVGKNNTELNNFGVFGGKVLMSWKLNLSNDFKDFDIFYNTMSGRQ